jgi:hypothetical protein
MSLTERHKADRALMAGTVAELAREHGLTAWVTGEQHGSRRTSVGLAGPHGLKLAMYFDGKSPQPDSYVLSWYGTEDGWRLNPGAFGNVNRFHGHKATDVAYDFNALVTKLGRRFAAIADGSAFTSDPEESE